MKSAFCAASQPGYARKSALAVIHTASAAATRANTVSGILQGRAATSGRDTRSTGASMVADCTAVAMGNWDIATRGLRRSQRADGGASPVSGERRPILPAIPVHLGETAPRSRDV